MYNKISGFANEIASDIKTQFEILNKLGIKYFEPRFISYAKAEDVVLLHENENDIYGDIASRCVDLFSELYSDNFKGVFDPANFVQCGQDTK